MRTATGIFVVVVGVIVCLLPVMSLAGNAAMTSPLASPLESTDRVLNKYWEEYLLLDNSHFLYANILPRFTATRTVGSSDAHSVQIGSILHERISRYSDPQRFYLNDLLGIESKAPGQGASLHFRLTPYIQELANSDAKPVHRIGLNAEGWFSPNPDWQVHLRGRLENHGELYPQFSGRVWEDKITGWLDNAAIYFYRDGFFGSFGRSFFVWGPEQRDALMISDNSPPFDRLWLGYEHRIFRFDYLITRLNDVISNDTTLVRYLAAHRLSFRKAGWFELGLSEVVLFGGYNRPLEWHFLNPFLPFYWEQWNARRDDNVFFGADLAIYWPERARIFGELMMDDFQIDFESEPHQVGYKLGIDAVEPFGAARLFTKLSYTRVNTTVYGQNKPQNVYLHHGSSIGYFGGNDQDRLLALARYHIGTNLDLEFEFQYNRRGEGRIEQHEAWGVPFGVDFPSGVVEKSPSLGLRLDFFLPSLLEGRLAVRYESFSNYQHQEGEDHNRWSLDFLVSWYLSGNLR